MCRPGMVLVLKDSRPCPQQHSERLLCGMSATDFRHRRVARDFSLLLGGGYISIALQVLRGLLLARLLGPTGLGTVAAISIIITYSLYSDLGMCMAAAREIPISIGSRDGRSSSWAWYGILARLAGSLAVSGGVLAYLSVSWGRQSGDLKVGLLAASAIIVLQGLVAAQQTILQSMRRFARASSLQMVLAVANLLGSIAGGASYGVRGVFVGQVMAYGVTAATGVYLSSRIRPEKLSMRLVRLLLRIGAPLAALSFADYNLVYIDQVMVISLLGRDALGVYWLVMFSSTLLSLAPAALGGVVGPRLLAQFGRNSSVESIAELTWEPVRLLSLTLPILIGAIWLLAPMLIVFLLPLYEPAIAPIRIYSIGAFFLGLNSGVSTTLLALKKHQWNLPIIGGCIGLNVAMDVVLVRELHLQLVGIALGSAITYFVYWMLHTLLVRHFFGNTLFAGVLANMKDGWPGVVLATAGILEWRGGILGSPSLVAGAIVPVAAVFVFFIRVYWQRISRLVREQENG